MNVVLKSTPRKYENMMDVLVPLLLDLLKKIDLLEQEIFVRDCALEKEKPALNIPRSQVHPKWNELMNEYSTRFERIIDGRVSKELRSRGYGNSFGNPGEYYYANSGEFSAEFTMRKENMASVVIHFNKPLDMKHKFVLRLIDGIWVIDGKYYAFEGEKTWYLHNI